MSNIDVLRQDLKGAGKSIKTLQAPANSAATAVGKIDEAINEPARMSKKLGKVGRVVVDLQEVSKFLGMFPYIGTVMRKVGTVFKEADRSIKELKKFCDGIDAKLEAPKAGLKKLEKPLSMAKKQLDTTQGQIEAALAILDQIARQYPDGVPPELDGILGRVRDAVSPIVVSLASIEIAIAPGLEAVKSAGDSANKALAPLAKATKAVSDLEAYLGVIAKPLSTLRSLLKPFKKWLKWLRWFMDKLNEAIDWALKQVHLDLDKMLKDLVDMVNPLNYLPELLKPELDALVTALKNITAPALGERLEALAQTGGNLARELEPLGSGRTLKLLFAVPARTRGARRRTRGRSAA